MNIREGLCAVCIHEPSRMDINKVLNSGAFILIRLFHAALWLERAPFREMVMLSTTDYWCKH